MRLATFLAPRTGSRTSLCWRPSRSRGRAPGDLILTGTPGGVGQAQDPPRFLAPGDTVRIEIDGLGAIEHEIGEARPR